MYREWKHEVSRKGFKDRISRMGLTGKNVSGLISLKHARSSTHHAVMTSASQEGDCLAVSSAFPFEQFSSSYSECVCVCVCVNMVMCVKVYLHIFMQTF